MNRNPRRWVSGDEPKRYTEDSPRLLSGTRLGLCKGLWLARFSETTTLGERRRTPTGMQTKQLTLLCF